MLIKKLNRLDVCPVNPNFKDIKLCKPISACCPDLSVSLIWKNAPSETFSKNRSRNLYNCNPMTNLAVAGKIL